MATSETSTHIFGTKDVASAGTAVALESTNYRLKSLLIIAHDDNVGRIFYGGDDVDSSTQKGLAPGASVTIGSDRAFNIADYFIDAANANDGVDFVGELI